MTITGIIGVIELVWRSDKHFSRRSNEDFDEVEEGAGPGAIIGFKKPSLAPPPRLEDDDNASYSRMAYGNDDDEIESEEEEEQSARRSGGAGRTIYEEDAEVEDDPLEGSSKPIILSFAGAPRFIASLALETA